VIDFERAAFPKDAGWHLEIGTQLDAPLHASIRLYVNSRQQRVVSAFVNAATPTPEGGAILKAIYADVARTIVEHALNQEALYPPAEMERDSIGFALAGLVRRFFPGQDFAVLRKIRVEHPGEFSSELFSQLKIFGD
jgi:hypothetical protein